MKLKYVDVPSEFAGAFRDAEAVVHSYFEKMTRDPARGSITIDGDRYVLVRADSMSIGFIEQMASVMGEEKAMGMLYSFSKAIGQKDAKALHRRMNLKDPVAKLSAGPVHFAFSGWGGVRILPESHPTPDDNFHLVYEHPNTFEADSYINNKIRTNHKVCVFSAGYSAGWCGESFGVLVDAKEVRCRARGDKECTFIMAPPMKLPAYVSEYTQKHWR